MTLIEYDHIKRLKRKDGGKNYANTNQNEACIAKLLISKNLLQKSFIEIKRNISK